MTQSLKNIGNLTRFQSFQFFVFVFFFSISELAKIAFASKNAFQIQLHKLWNDFNETHLRFEVKQSLQRRYELGYLIEERIQAQPMTKIVQDIAQLRRPLNAAKTRLKMFTFVIDQIA